jgi:hypothetical protein
MEMIVEGTRMKGRYTTSWKDVINEDMKGKNLDEDMTIGRKQLR